jgi:hypothetical protein
MEGNAITYQYFYIETFRFLYSLIQTVYLSIAQPTRLSIGVRPHTRCERNLLQASLTEEPFTGYTWYILEGV